MFRKLNFVGTLENLTKKAKNFFEQQTAKVITNSLIAGSLTIGSILAPTASIVIKGENASVVIDNGKAQAFSNNEAFRIESVSNSSLVLDGYGDNLPSTKTHVQLFDRNSAFNTAQFQSFIQPQYNNSYEIHMLQDRGLCFGPDVTARSQMRNGVRAVIKRDCGNTLNHLYESVGGENYQIRVNNTNFCLDIPGNSAKPGQYLNYYDCNKTLAQMFRKTFISKDPGKEVRQGSCYRKPNTFPNVQYPCTFIVDPNFRKLTWKSGAWAEIRYDIPNPTGSKYGGTTANIHFNNTNNTVTLPSHVTKYDIWGWNEGQTTHFNISN